MEANKEPIEANKGAIAANHAAIASNTAANEQENTRFSELADYDTKATVTLYYPVDGSDLNEEQKAELADLAKKASGFQAYIVRVAGYTDSSGDAAYNEKLSENRAENLVSYLQQTGDIPLRHIVAERDGRNQSCGFQCGEGSCEQRNHRAIVNMFISLR